MMARGVFNSCAAAARASRQQEQCSSLKTSNGLIGGVLAGCMGTTPPPSRDSDRASTYDFLGKNPKVRFTAILSTKTRPWFNGHLFPGGWSGLLSIGGDLILAQLATK